MADFGAQLREARERKGISLRQIAASTKISVAALEGLERNDISKLPGGIFSRAFVRSYAIEVGLDPDDTVRQFLQTFAGVVAAPSPVPPPAPTRPAASAPRPAEPPQKPPPSTAKSSAAAEPGGSNDEVDFESKQRMAAVVLKLVLVSVPIAAAIIYFSSRGSAPASGSDQGARPEAAAAAKTEAPADEEDLPAAGAGDAEAGSGSIPQTAPAPAAATTAPPAAPLAEGERLRLEVVPTADCWVKLTVDGVVAVSRVIAAGDREAREFSESAVLQVGDAAACAIAINGRPARPLGRPRQVREIRVTRENYRSFLR